MSKKLLIKKPRVIEVDDKKVTVSKFEKHLVDDTKDFSTQFGMIKKNELKKESIKVGKEEYEIIKADFIDEYKQIKRLAQIIILKDIGAIITNTGINNKSNVLESGTGSGGLSCFLAKIANKIISYDINDEHQLIAKKNAETLKLKNIEFKKGSIYNPKEIREKEIDVMILDVPEPWNAIKTSEKTLKKGGFLVSYSPNINQTQKFVKTLNEKFLYEKTIEVIEREWSIKEEVLRPRMKDIGHTAFLSFARKIKE